MAKKDKKSLDISSFLEKVIENEVKRVKIIQLEVANYGLIEFVRPKEGVMLNYITNMVKSSKMKVDENGMEFKDINMEEFLKAGSEFVYSCCPLLQSKEVRDKYSNNDPYDIPGIVFGSDVTLDLAKELNEVFKGKKVKEKVEETIKN
ncbi:MAG: hypothetical protein ACRCXY_03595 [Fusobacteriaceae bacterium]